MTATKIGNPQQKMCDNSASKLTAAAELWILVILCYGSSGAKPNVFV